MHESRLTESNSTPIQALPAEGTKRLHMTNGLIPIGIGFTALFWLFESWIHASRSDDGNLLYEILHPDLHDLWMRPLVCLIIISFSVYANVVVRRLRRTKASLQKLSEYLEHRVKERTAELDTTNRKLRGAVDKYKQTEHALRESEVKYRRIVEDQTEFLVRWMPDGTRTFVNDSYCRYFGVSYDETIGTSFFPLITEDYREEVRKRIKSARPENPASTGEHKVIRPDGTIGWNQWTDRAIFDEEGKLTEFQSVGQDITKRKEAEEALRKERDRAQKYLDVAGVMFVNIDAEGKVSLVNKKACDILGYKEEEILDKNWFDNFLPERNREFIKEVFYKLIAGEIEGAEYCENPVLTKDGKERIIAWHNTILREEGGKIIGTLSSGEDVTERKKAEEQLAIFKKFAESSTQGLGMADLEGRIVYCNDALCYSLTGEVEQRKVLGRQVSRYYDEKTAKKLQETILPLVLEIGQWTGELPLVSVDGKMIDAIQSIFLIHNDKGEPMYFANVVTDITERKKTEEALKASLQTSDDIVRAIPSGLFIYQFKAPDRLILINGNLEAERLTNIKVKDWIGKEFNEIWAAAQECGITEAYLDVMRTGETYETEDLHYKDHRINGAFRIRTFRLPGNRLAAAFEDITERKRAEDTLRRHDEFLGSLLDSLTHPFLVVDVNDYTVEMANSAVWKEGKAKGKMCYEVSHKRDCPCDETEHPCPLEQIKRTRQPMTVEHVHYDELGDARDVEVHCYPLFDDQGNVNKMIEYCLDITERKQLEEQARQRQGELAHVSRLSTVGEMASGLAHELNQPLCAIQSRADLCLRAIDGRSQNNDKIKENLQTIEGQAERAGNVIRRIKAFVKKREPNRSTVNISNIVRETLAFVDSEIRNHNIKVSLDLLEQIPMVLADRVQIEQVLLNLIRNAVEAMDETEEDKRYLTIKTLKDSDDTIRVVVRDNGKGLTSEIEERLFDAFFTTKPADLGIGLSISRSIINVHEGELRGQCNPDGKGSTFTFTLPISESKVCS